MRRRAVAVLTCLLVFLCGCAVDVQSYLQPPRAQGQQQAVQAALEAAIGENGEGAPRYTLKYPVAGDILSAYIFLDGVGKQTSAQEAETAAILYAPEGAKNTHIHLLRREQGGWRSLADLVGAGLDVDRVLLGDLDGDGTAELLIGWSLYSTERQLSAYRLDGKTAVESIGQYTACVTADLNADGRDEVLLLRSDRSETMTATLYAVEDSAAKVLSAVKLDPAIRTVSRFLYGKTSDGGDALYIDAKSESGALMTEIVAFRDGKLLTPLHAAGQHSTVSTRVAKVAAMDADGNGVPEFPVTSRLAAYPNATGEDTWQWLTEWYSWDMQTGEAERQFAAIVNRTDGYFIEVEDQWIATLTTRYDMKNGVLWLDTVTEEGAKPFLAVQAQREDAQASVDGYAFETLGSGSTLRIWYDDTAAYRLTPEKISYMLVTLS